LLLASGDLLPRQRARSQEPDVAGLKLKRQLLDRLAAIDPEPEQLEASLHRLVEEIGPPTGPTRAVARSFWEEWQAACASPELVGHLLGQAALHSSGRDHHGR
jgi:hypothetical protein